MKSRKQRKQEARLNGVQFEPQYNGNSPVSYREHFGVGSERFNNRFVDFTAKEIEKNDLEAVVKPAMESDVIDTETVKSNGLLARAKGLFKKN